MLTRQRTALSLLLFVAACSPSSPADGGGSDSSAQTSTASGAIGRPHRRCGWVFTSEPAGADSFTRNADAFDALHPVWYALNSDGVTFRALADSDDPVVVETARAHRVAIIPTVASVENANWTRAMLYDPAKRAKHIQALVKLAVSKGYDGLDLDYEALWDKADGAPLGEFVKAFGQAMHAAGKVADMAVPALAEPSTVWKYAELADALDHVHLMAYDFHVVGGSHAGPTAPLGWVDAAAAYAAKSSGHPERFILGLPNYGMTRGAACDLAKCPKSCYAQPVVDTSEMTSCASNPKGYAAGRVLRCNSDAGALYFDDPASIAEKAERARAHGLGGLAYWKLGGEPDGFFDSLKRYY